MKTTDFAIVGAGPAGLAAAAEARALGLTVTLLDEQDALGGQIYRRVEAVASDTPERLGALGEDYAHGLALAEAVRASGADYLPSALVWQVEPDGLWYLKEGRSHEVRSRRLLLATGALERPVPIPGWTLPGVMTAGGAQILLKSSGLVPAGACVLAGNGPLLFLLASQILAAGGSVSALVETVPRRRYLQAAAQLPAALGSGYLSKGLKLLKTVKAAGVPLYRHASDLRVEGDAAAEALSFTSAGRRHRLAAELVVLHEGVVPNQQMTRALGCAHLWDARQLCFRPRLDDWGNSSVEGVMVAGDGGGIGGARAAEHAGRLAALEAAHALGRIEADARDRRARRIRRRLDRLTRGRPFLEVLYAPAPAQVTPADPVTVCRCEEVTAGQVREAVRIGCTGPNQVKAFLRCGMGPCQGRYCGTTVAALVAQETGADMDATGYYRIRPPIKPIPLAALASAEAEDADGGTAE